MYLKSSKKCYEINRYYSHRMYICKGYSIRISRKESLLTGREFFNYKAPLRARNRICENVKQITFFESNTSDQRWAVESPLLERLHFLGDTQIRAIRILLASQFKMQYSTWYSHSCENYLKFLRLFILSYMTIIALYLQIILFNDIFRDWFLINLEFLHHDNFSRSTIFFFFFIFLKFLTN